MRVGIGQINPTVGAIEQNADRIIERIGEARAADCRLVVFPELTVPGYSPLDLVWRPGFVDACARAVDRIREATSGLAVIVGSILAEPHRGAVNRLDLSSSTDGAGIDLFNAAILIEDRRIVGHAAKTHLPTYDVYDEKRYFAPSPGTEIRTLGGLSLGVNICEDLWVDEGPTELQASLGADWIVNLSASPFYEGKPQIRAKMVSQRARENAVGVIYVNLVGGQDDVVFDGGSLVVNASGEPLLLAPSFEEGLFVADLSSEPVQAASRNSTDLLRRALVLGIRDYVRKNGFSHAILGLSGGIDSAVVAALAAEAMGPESVQAVFMASEFSSEESRTDARETARRLAIELLEIPIDQAHQAMRDALPKQALGLVDENLQPRIRGTLLMALANQQGSLVLCPGNKSEAAVGYSTLYGDTVGALAPIADLYKDDVYRIARTFGEGIPERILTKPPSAELRPNQRDDDDLPSYPELDPILRVLIEEGCSRAQAVARGFDADLVDDILGRLYRNEYKRRQLPPGIKVTPKAFGGGRRVPMTNRYRD